MSEWQPIESYPYGSVRSEQRGLERGPRCFVYLPQWKIGGVGIGYRDHTGDTAFDVEGIQITRYLKPTHWMPLPKPPEKANG